MSRWASRIDRLKNKQRGVTYQNKTPDTWPFCIGCHLAAPDAPYPMDARKPTGPRAPDLSKWGAVEVPNANDFREKHHTCPNCTVAVVLKLTHINKLTAKKLKDIAEAEARNAGLVPLLEQSVRKYDKRRIVHADDCGIHEAGEDLPECCTCGAAKHIKR